MSVSRNSQGGLQPGQAGQTLVEYGLILGLISLIAMAGLAATQGGVVQLYDALEQVAVAIQDVMSP